MRGAARQAGEKRAGGRGGRFGRRVEKRGVRLNNVWDYIKFRAAESGAGKGADADACRQI